MGMTMAERVLAWCGCTAVRQAGLGPEILTRKQMDDNAGPCVRNEGGDA